MKKLLGKKRFFIPIMVIALLAAMVGTAFAVNDTWNSTSGFPLQYENYFNMSPTFGIQKILSEITTNEHDYDQPVTGYFYSITDDNVRLFQGDEGITVDGKVGNQGWGKLKGHVSENRDSGWWKYFVIDSGTSEYILQSDDGYWYVYIDGNYYQINSMFG